jgi:carbamoyltransferase
MIIIRPPIQEASGKLLAHLKTIGISAFYHDSAAALVVEEWIVGAAQKERFSRKNHDGELKKKEIN